MPEGIRRAAWHLSPAMRRNGLKQQRRRVNSERRFGLNRNRARANDRQMLRTRNGNTAGRRGGCRAFVRACSTTRWYPTGLRKRYRSEARCIGSEPEAPHPDINPLNHTHTMNRRQSSHIPTHNHRIRSRTSGATRSKSAIPTIISRNMSRASSISGMSLSIGTRAIRAKAISSSSCSRSVARSGSWTSRPALDSIPSG